MKLSKEDLYRKELGQEAKGFLEGNLFQALQRHLSEQLDKEYPKPVGDQWQDQYRWAKAYEEVSAEIIRYISGLKNDLSRLTEMEKEKESSIEDA